MHLANMGSPKELANVVRAHSSRSYYSESLATLRHQRCDGLRTFGRGSRAARREHPSGTQFDQFLENFEHISRVIKRPVECDRNLMRRSHQCLSSVNIDPTFSRQRSRNNAVRARSNR
jgi:hypothetical protein